MPSGATERQQTEFFISSRQTESECYQVNIFRHAVCFVVNYYIWPSNFPSSHLPSTTTPPVRYKVVSNKTATSITLLLIFDRALKYFMIKKNKKKFAQPFPVLFNYLTIFIYQIMLCKKAICQSHSSKKYLRNPYIRKIRKRKRQLKVSLLICKEFSIWLFLL